MELNAGMTAAGQYRTLQLQQAIDFVYIDAVAFDDSGRIILDTVILEATTADDWVTELQARVDEALTWLAHEGEHTFSPDPPVCTVCGYPEGRWEEP
jgi:hypothetical protein